MMTNDEAKAVLSRAHFIRRVGRYAIVGEHNTLYVSSDGVADLRCRFSADQLEAIATWMRDPEGVANA